MIFSFTDIKYEINTKKIKTIILSIIDAVITLGTEYLLNILTMGRNIINKKNAPKNGKIISLARFSPATIIIMYANLEINRLYSFFILSLLYSDKVKPIQA